MANHKDGNKYVNAVMIAIWKINEIVPYTRLLLDQFSGERSIVMPQAGQF